MRLKNKIAKYNIILNINIVCFIKLNLIHLTVFFNDNFNLTMKNLKLTRQ